MVKATSIHITAAKASADRHNKREKDLSYVRKEMEEGIPLEKWCWEHPDYTSVSKMKKQAEKEYYDKEITVTGNHGTYVTHRSMPKTAEPVKEGVIVIDCNVTIEQLRAFGDWVHEAYGVKPMGIYIHYGEGHWATLDEEEGQTEDMYRRNDGFEWKRQNEFGETEYWKPNLHAHMVFDWFNHETGRCFNLPPRVMVQMEDKLSEFLNMKRGEHSNRDWLNSVAFKAKAERERMAKEKARYEEKLRLAEAEVKKANKTVASLTTMISNLQKKIEKGEGDILELEEKLADKQQKLEEAKKKASDADEKRYIAEDNLRKVEAELLKKKEDHQILKKQLYKDSSDYLKFRSARTEEDKKFQPKYESLLKACAYEEYQEAFSNVIVPSLMDFQMEKIEENAPIIPELLDNAEEVMQCALFFMQGYVKAANSVFPGGGGGVSSDLPWRDKDDDDARWARKCFDAAVNLSRNSSSDMSQRQRRGKRK